MGDGVFLARMDEYQELHRKVRSPELCHDLSVALNSDSEDTKRSQKLLLQEDSTLEHLVLRHGEYHHVEGFLETAVSKLSSLKIEAREEEEMLAFGEEEIRSFHDAIAAAKHKGLPIKLKTLFLWRCKVDVDALARSALPNCLERLALDFCEHFPGALEKLLQGPACNIWELCLTESSLSPALFQAPTSLRKLTLLSLPDDQALLSQICSELEGLELRDVKSKVKSKEVIYLLAASINDNPKCKLRFLGLKVNLELLEVKDLSELLGRPNCLESFSMDTWVPEDWAWAPKDLAYTVQIRILDILWENYSSRIQKLHIMEGWQNAWLEGRWLRLKQRNYLFQKSPPLEGPPVQPSTAKLFMCGHTGSGKTTISKNLVRSNAVLWQCVQPLQQQNHASTVGIRRRTLTFRTKEKMKLLIYDLGGQEVYHAFHHYFIRGSDKDLFLVVCKVGDHPEDLETELQYWFRFIAAHQSATPRRKPTIFLILNIFVRDNRISARAAAEKISTKYKDTLDFVEGQDGYRYFEVNGRSAYEVQTQLKYKLERAVEEILYQVPLIPWSCEDVIRRRASSTPWYHIRTRAQAMVQERVVHLPEMSKTLFKEKVGEVSGAAMYTFMCLHDMGEAVYFGADDAYRNRDFNDQEAALIIKNAVLDMPWFLHKVLSIFIPQQERNDEKKGEPRWSTEKAEEELKAIGETAKGNICFLLKLLCEMGVLIPDGSSTQIKWSEPRNLPSHLIVPSLLRNEFPGWIGDEQTYDCWGRRLQGDTAMKGFVLLPSGVFAVIQAKVKDMCNKWGHESQLGAGWVFFQEDLIQVLVTVGGDYKHWTDRQWVDIMLMVPKEKKRGLKGEQFLKEIQDCVTMETSRACPFIKLEEHVLNPEKVRQFGKASRQQSSSCSANRSGKSSYALQKVKQMVDSESDGFSYHFTWEGGDSTSVLELLMPSEINEIIQPRKLVLDEVVTEYNQYIVPVYQKQQQFVHVEIPEFKSDDMNKLARFINEVLKQHGKSIEDLNVSITNIRESLKNLHEDLKNTENALIKSYSSLLGSIKLECPKLPHITMESNPLPRYLPLIGKRATIYYLCEHPSGYHLVDDWMKFEGVPITIPNEWFKKYSNIFVPAITACFTLLKLGKMALPVGGELVGTIVDLSENGLKTALSSSFQGDLNSSLEPASQDDIRELFEYVKQNDSVRRYGEDQELMMKKCFGLYGSPRGWVCKRHH